MKIKYFFPFFFLFHALFCYSQTNIKGIISSNTFWTISGSPYIITGNTLVQEGIVLEIEPGVVVKFDTTKELQVDGTLIAKGISNNLIIFTSNLISPYPGSWGQIHFTNKSKGSALYYCNFYYGGAILKKGLIYANGCYVNISNCIFQYSLSSGLHLEKTTQDVLIDSCNFIAIHDVLNNCA